VARFARPWVTHRQATQPRPPLRSRNREERSFPRNARFTGGVPPDSREDPTRAGPNARRPAVLRLNAHAPLRGVDAWRRNGGIAVEQFGVAIVLELQGAEIEPPPRTNKTGDPLARSDQPAATLPEHGSPRRPGKVPDGSPKRPLSESSAVRPVLPRPPAVQNGFSPPGKETDPIDQRNPSYARTRPPWRIRCTWARKRTCAH